MEKINESGKMIHRILETPQAQKFTSWGGIQFTTAIGIAIFQFTVGQGITSGNILIDLVHYALLLGNFLLGVYLFQIQFFGEDRLFGNNILVLTDDVE